MFASSPDAFRYFPQSQILGAWHSAKREASASRFSRRLFTGARVRRRQPVETSRADCSRRPPLTLDQALTLERGKAPDRAPLLNLERAARDLLNSEQHTVAVQPAERDGLG